MAGRERRWYGRERWGKELQRRGGSWVVNKSSLRFWGRLELDTTEGCGCCTAAAVSIFFKMNRNETLLLFDHGCRCVGGGIREVTQRSNSANTEWLVLAPGNCHYLLRLSCSPSCSPGLFFAKVSTRLARLPVVANVTSPKTACFSRDIPN